MSCLCPVFSSILYTPGAGTSLDPENLSILILLGSRLFGLSVYAPDQEPARALKIWVYGFRPGPGFSSFLYTPQNKNLPGPGKFEYTDPALGRTFRAFCIRSKSGAWPAPKNSSILYTPTTKILTWILNFWVYRFCPGPALQAFCIRSGSGACPDSEFLSIQVLPRARLFEHAIYALEPGACPNPDFLSIQILPWAQFFRVSCIRH